MKTKFLAICLVVTIFVLCLLTLGNPSAPAQQRQSSAPQLGMSSVKEVISAMTTEEKVRLLVGMGMNLESFGLSIMDEDDKKIPEKVPGAAGRTHAIPRLGIPSLTLSDGPAGVRINPIRNGNTSKTYYATGFPIATLLASSWDPSLVHRVGVALGVEAREYGMELLNTILRREWGFKGFVMTDWFGGNDAVAQMRAGNDLLMPGTPDQTTAIVSATGNGTLSKEQLDENVERVLNLVVESLSFKGYKYSEQPDLRAHAQIAREAAAEGMVLLKNESNALPVAPSSTIALFGYSSYDLIAGGTGSGDVNKAYVISLHQGLAAAGHAVDASLKNVCTQYIAEQKSKRPKPLPFFPPAPIPEMTIETDILRKAADDADVAVITLGRSSCEFSDRKVEDDFTLSTTEQALLKNVAKAFHAKAKKVVAVLNVAGPIEVASWRGLVDAILLAWQPGQEGGHSISDVLSGKVNPSGKLVMTFPVVYSDVPSSKTFPGQELVGQKPLIAKNPFAGKPAESFYEEGIFVGYRYYNTFRVKPAYEFGYGLSYTNFSYSDFRMSSNQFDGKLTATVSVMNTGKVSGKDVVELYIHAPNGKLSKPDRELRAFAKTDLLRPGQSQTLKFTITAEDLSSYDSSSSSWIAEAGPYTVLIGASSMDIKKSFKFELGKDLLVEKVNKLMSPQREIEELRPERRVH